MVNLKKIEIYGFKSFADKIEVNFKDNVTAIVGPNGCGKSNVSDAIRWALGERALSTLRGSEQTDFIFKGSETRHRMSYCEVSLIFDNANRIFPYDFNEVVITRKVIRSGDGAETEYLLNRTPCKQRDIVNMLQDTGMGNSSYCVIGQGQTAKILSDKPEERRGLFEEAAGISGFKKKRNEAERSLNNAHADLLRIIDQQADRASRIGPLAKQAEKTQKYNICRDKLKYHEVNSYLYHYNNASEAKRKISEKVKGLYEELLLRESEKKKAEDDYSRAMAGINATDGTIDALKREQTDLLINAEHLKGKGRQMEERLSFLRRENERLSLAINTAESEYSSKAEEITGQIELINELTSELNDLSHKVAQMEVRYNKLAGDIGHDQAEIEESNKRIRNELAELGDVKLNIGKYKAELDSLIERMDINKEKIARITGETGEVRAQEEKYQTQIIELEEKKAENENRSEKLSADIKQAEAEAVEANDKAISAHNRITALESRLVAIEDMRKSYSGYHDAVRNLMLGAKNDKTLASKFYDVVAKLIKVPEKIEFAIGQVLGGNLQNIVVPSEEDAKYIFRYLKENRCGNVTCLPLTTVKPYYLENEFMPVLRERSVLGIASDLVQYDKKYDKAIKNLLGKTVIVEDMDTAVAAARNYRFGFRIVTLEGEILNTSGSMSGGSGRAADGRILNQEREINQLKESIETARAEHRDALKNHGDAKNIHALLIQQSVSADTLARDIAIELATRREQFASVREELSDSDNEIRILNDENAEMLRRSTLISEKLRAVDERGSGMSEQQININNMLRERQAQYEAKLIEKDELQNNLSDMKLGVQATQKSKEAAEAAVIRLKAERENLMQQALEDKSRILTNEAEIRNAETEASNANLSDEEKEKINGTKNRIEELENNKKALQESISVLDEKRSIIGEQIVRIMEAKSKEEASLDRIDTDIEMMQVRIWDNYQLHYASALALKDDNYDITASQGEIRRLRREMSEIGEINPGAIEEYSLIKDEYERCIRQREDAENAEKNLINIIRELNEIMLNKFNTEFAKIAENFTRSFKELFGGGVGRLAIQETDGDPLDAGIDIFAEPPGKKLQNINLLSGGERALTAIAIMFAIIKLRPLPFCMLDEIDSPLDESNAKLLAEYLRLYSRNTQFIVITHKKPTMELADSLYGVTMQEKGVSKIVTVTLKDAMKHSDAQKLNSA